MDLLQERPQSHPFFCVNLINLCYQRIHIITIHGSINFRINSSQIK